MPRVKRKTKAQDLERVRSNQRRCRQRKRDYVAELESKIASYEEASIQANRGFQIKEEKLNREIQVLWAFLDFSGADPTVVEQHIAEGEREGASEEMNSGNFAAINPGLSVETHADTTILPFSNVTSNSIDSLMALSSLGLELSPLPSAIFGASGDFTAPNIYMSNILGSVGEPHLADFVTDQNISDSISAGVVNCVLQDTTLCTVAFRIVDLCNKKNVNVLELDIPRVSPTLLPPSIYPETYEIMYEEVQSCYSDIAKRSISTDAQHINEEKIAMAFGYNAEHLRSLPDKANLGLSCGNPVAQANIKKGETILDLGSGGGIDVFLAARKVGPEGKAIGVDMTKDMIKLANENASSIGLSNTLFIEASITAIPLPDSTVDCIISNCVINLVPRNDKASVFREIARMLKPGGRVAIIDILAKKELPRNIVGDMVLYVGCIAGASQVVEYEEYLRRAAFKDVLIVDAKSDLNLYKQSTYLGLGSCCGATGSSKEKGNSSEIDFNEWVGSFQIYAVKTS